MDAFFNLLGDYGPWVYGLLFLYCSLKSGALPLFGGYAAYQGALDPVLVAAVSFAGGYLGDEARFWAARKYGENVLSRRAFARRAMNRAQLLMAHYGIWYIFLYRYPKGLRTIGALPVGLGSMRWPRFSFLNATSAAVWACLLVGAGYYFGEAVAHAASENWGLVSVLLLVGFVGLGALAWWRVSRLGSTVPATVAVKNSGSTSRSV